MVSQVSWTLCMNTASFEATLYHIHWVKNKHNLNDPSVQASRKFSSTDRTLSVLNQCIGAKLRRVCYVNHQSQAVKGSRKRRSLDERISHNSWLN
jgi:hypothetical protein